MFAMRIRRTVEKHRNEVMGLMLRKYPSFIWSDRGDESSGIPTFVFHAVTAESLESLFHFLFNNGYTTLTGDDYLARQSELRSDWQRTVLLTFDDGHKSLYTVAYPALKRFGFKAMAYVVPGMIPEGSAFVQAGSPESALCNWDEIREMHESGVVDIQSHSMHHHSISISSRVVDFARPAQTFSFLDSDLAPMMEAASLLKKPDDLPYGTPIHEWGARYGAAPAWHENPTVRRACIHYVASQGGAVFFRQRDWHSRLLSVLAKARQSNPPERENAAEQRNAILNDLVESKREIERRLPGKVVRHFCYPWFRGSPLAVSLSVTAGYVSNAWGSILPPFVHTTESPLPLARYAPSYIWRLPGRGRQPLSTVLQQRFRNSGGA